MAAKKKATAKGRKAPARTVSAKPTAPARAKIARPAKKVARKAPVAKAAAAVSSAEALAKKIVRYTTNESAAEHIAELYTDDCVSVEATGDTVTGHDGLTSKFEQWNAFQEHSSFHARNVLIKGNVIMIEWEGDIKLRDGRSISFAEIAVHELRGGKIASERYYYNPAQMSGGAQGRIEVPPEPLAPVNPPRGTPPVDPLDL